MKCVRTTSLTSVVLAAGLSLTGCRRDPGRGMSGQELPAVKVRVQTAENKSRVVTEEVVGTVRAKLRASIEAKVSGRIEQMLVSPGQTVKAGELLARLDAREIQARLDQALALRERYGRDTERLRRLLAEKAVSQQEFENMESRHRVAAASVTEAETMLGYTKVVAPFAGVITRKLADVGDLAAPGRALVEIDDPAALRLEADVPESLIKNVAQGAKLRVRPSADESPVEAMVGEIAPVADPSTRTFNVKLDLPAGTGLRAGQFARLAVPVGESKALRVPAAAVIQRGQMELVFVAANQHGQLRLVKSGKRIGDETEIVSGISAGEQVVVEGAATLRDGQAVEIAR